MKIKFAAALALILLPALALAHPTDASLHTRAQLHEHAGRMHSHAVVAHRS